MSGLGLAVGHDSIVKGQESVWWFFFQPGQSSNRMRILFKWSCVNFGSLVFVVGTRGACVWSGSSLLSLSLFWESFYVVLHGCQIDLVHKDWGPFLSRNVFSSTISQWVTFDMDQSTVFESRACPWLAQIEWPLVYLTLSLAIVIVWLMSSWCVVQLALLWLNNLLGMHT
jgi:hypothetical protein